MKNSKHIQTLFQKYLSRENTEAELQELLDHFSGMEEADFRDMIAFNPSADTDAELAERLRPSLLVLDQSIRAELNARAVDKLSVSSRRKPILRYVAAAAVAAVMFSAGIWFLNKPVKQPESSVYAQEVLPGKQGATLTLASGKKIRLSDAANGELASEAGVLISKAENGQLVYELKGDAGEGNKLNTLSTANGETYQLRLPDGSLVVLNAASSITYSANLIQNGQRRIKLSGEAYLEVAKDKAHPFVVESKGQEVEVLGTHFNINSYENEPAILTTLVKGSVKVTNGNLKQVLKPGQQAINTEKTISVVEANIENITDWKDGDFYFERVDFRSAMRKIARWYDVEIIYDASVPADIKSGGWISRNNKLSAVLKSIEKSGLVHFRIEDRKIYVTK